MPKLALLGGAYKSRSSIANAQRCINLFPEKNAEDAPFPTTHYPTPGLTKLAAPGVSGRGRGLYTDSTGNLYAVVGANVYYVTPTWTMTLLGSIVNGPNPVSMIDNGNTVVLVDGSAAGYQINIQMKGFSSIPIGGGFYGADRVDYVDTFLLFNRPGTNQWYYALSNTIGFNSLNIAAKTGYPDLLMGVAVMHRDVWLIGQKTTEIWYNSGAADFTFQIFPGAFVEHGCISKYSIAQQDLSLFWLSQDKQGNCIVLKGENYQVQRVSTYAIEAEFSSYGNLADAVAFTYQQQGHSFYVLNFPSADTTWVYDIGEGLWHQRAYMDVNGILHRARPMAHAYAYGTNVVLDWQNGNLLKYDASKSTDWSDGAGPNSDLSYPILRARSWPHIVNDGKRVSYLSFIASMDCGNDTGVLDGSSSAAPPTASLRWSDDGGKTFGTPLQISLGALGQTNNLGKATRLGLGRDRVFDLFWSQPAFTALNGAWVETKPCKS